YKELGDVLQVDEKKSFSSLIKTWQRNEAVPYTWDTFLSALRKIGENKIANSIEDKLIEYPEEYLVTSTSSNAQQEDFCLLVVMNLTLWGFESDDEFTLSIISKEINDGKTFSMPFKWDDQQMQEKLDYAWRILEKGTHIQYDSEIKPSHGLFKSLIKAQLSPHDAVSNALCLYIDWAIEQNWMTINPDAAEADINENAKKISEIDDFPSDTLFFKELAASLCFPLDKSAGLPKSILIISKFSAEFRVAVEKLWMPMLKEFKEDLGRLHNGLQMPLKKVKHLFNDLSDKTTINEELTKWCCAVDEPDQSWIRDAAQKILDYQELCRYSYSAQTLMQLKKTLKLSGDFSSVEALLPKEGIKDDGDVTLATVKSSAAETADILKDIADVPHRRACLETFCSCMSLVAWVRKVALNLGQLQNVVQVANQTLDGDLVKQLLQDLLKFGSAFAPLIYEVDQKESCEALINRCKAMWPLIDECQNLMKITDSCNARLGELKRVEESLSDFQKSNVEQMDSINTRGTYHIEAIPGKIIHSPDEVVCLRMRLAQDQTKQQKIFKLDDLRELQSKLVLVAAENADKVNKFIETLSKVEGIAILLKKLQEAGVVDYTHFRLVCGCSEYKKKDFDSTIKSMENDLKDWQKNVEKYRKQYPHLNYYTSQQLFDLRTELGSLKKDPKSVASQSLKQLLLSVTSNPSHAKIFSSLNNAVKTMSKNLTSLEVQHKNIFNTKFPLPTFDPSSLSDERKKVLKALLEDYKFKVSVILAAFSELEEDADEGKVFDWCVDNEHKFKDVEDVELSTAVKSIDTSEEDGISENNPLVLELLAEKYSLKIAIEAVQKAKQDPQLAREIASDLYVGKTETNTLSSEYEWSATKYTQVPLSVKMEVEKGVYLDFVELGEFLKELAYQEATVSFGRRQVHYRLVEEGKVNLLAIDTASTWKALLFLYMADEKKPLPTHEEVLICTKNTTVEEVTLLWHRAVNDEEKRRLFCLVNADQLPFSVSEKVLDNLEMIIQGSKNFRIVVLINAKDQAKNHLASRLSLYLKKFPKLPSDKEIAEYISTHISLDLDLPVDLKASSDQERQTLISLNKNVHVVASRSTGMGKTLRVKRMTEIIKRINKPGKLSYVSIPIHGPEVSVRHMLKLMKECKQDPTNTHPQLIHFNIAQDMIDQIDWLLFKIIVLGGLDDECGNIWRRVDKQVCVVECTLTKLDLEYSDDLPQEEVLPSVYALLSYFPQTICELPNQVQDQSKSKFFVAMDEHVFKEESVQRVYQYLRRVKANQELDQFKLKKFKKPEGTGKECLECLLQYNSNKSIASSWSDIRNFVQFLNAHLYDCEQSPYCSVDDLKGFKKFVVKFSILMAKEFTEPSMDDADNYENQNFNTPKKWDTCSHPYLFFNQDGYTMTFLGLWVDEDGNLLDYNNGKVIEHNFMDKRLRNVLHHNNVCFQEDYKSWD
uniref:Death domain-containing protein n=1 Tax=Amphimedon queenslandica TaxID=400682 RepID=A0A1X7THY6_AMPQE